MPTASQARATSPTTATPSAQAAPAPIVLDPSSCQHMVSRLYTPQLVAKRRMISAAQEADEKRIKGSYDATRDTHLANFWHRQREVKQTIRCFANNSRHRAMTPGVVCRTTVNDSRDSNPSLPKIQQTASSSRSRGSDERTHTAVDDQSHQSPPPAGASSPQVEPPSPDSSRSSRTSSFGSPETSMVRASPPPASLNAKQSKASDHDGPSGSDYSSEYESDFYSDDAGSPTKVRADNAGSPTTAQGGDAAANASGSAADAPARSTEDASPAVQQQQQSNANETALVPADRSNEASHLPSVTLTPTDLATLVMLVAPSVNFAASVRRLELHDGIDMGWLTKQAPASNATPTFFTLLDIPDHEEEAAAATQPASNRPETQQPSDASKPSTAPDSAGDPEIETRSANHCQANASSTNKGGTETRKATPGPQSINSPRSALLVMRHGVEARSLWPVSYKRHLQDELLRGSSKTVVRHRYELKEATRKATLLTLRNQYGELNAVMSREAVLMQLRDALARRNESGVLNQSSRISTRSSSAQKSRPASTEPALDATGVKHERRRLRVEKQFKRAMDLEWSRTAKALERHELELVRDANLRQKRQEEAEERARRGRERDSHVYATVDAGQQILETHVRRVEAELDFVSRRSDRAKRRAEVERLARDEYARATRDERERFVAAHERRAEFEKLQVLQAAQERQDNIDRLLFERELERRKQLEAHRQQRLRLQGEAARLQRELLQSKRKGLLPTTGHAAMALPPRAHSALQ